MKTAPLPENETERLAALRRYHVLDTQPEKEFNDLAQLAAHICGTLMAAVTFVDERRQWYKSRVGFDLAESPREVSFCAHAILQPDLFVVEDTRRDERFLDSPLVVGEPFVRFFAGSPLTTPDGYALGTLAVLDRTPRRLTEQQADTLQIIARQVMAQLELRRSVAELAQKIEEHQRMEGQLRNSESFYHTLVETLPQNIFRKDREGRFTFANQRFCESAGQPLEALLGKTDFDFFPRELATKYVTDDRSVMNTRETLDTVEAYVGPTGEQHFNHVIKTPLYGASGEVIGIQGIFWDVTQRKKMEEELESQRDLLRALLATIPDRIFFKDLHSRFIQCSFSQARRLGLNDPAEVIGKTDFDFYPRQLAQEFFEAEQRVMRTGEPIVNKLQHHLDLEGRDIWSSVTKVALRNRAGAMVGMIGLTRDVTDLIQTEHALRQTEKKYRTIYENAVEGIFQTTPDGRYLSANPALARLYGYSSPEALIQALTDIEHQLYLDPQRREEFQRLIREKGEVVGFESQVRRQDGSIIWISEAARAVRDARGNVLYYEGAVEDITARKQAEALQEKARQEALESAQLKAQFLANMSHEIRTPMNAIVGMTDVLVRSKLDPDQREHVEIIRSSTESLLEIINRILDFSKLEAGKLDLERIDFELQQTVENVAELLAVRAHEKGVDLHCWVDPSIPPIQRGDPGRVRQILINLVGNAVKFTERGEVVLTVVLVEATADRARVRFEIRDTGIGIDETARQRIFQEFAQADGSTTRKYGGTGLGLTISKQYVELMGGQIGFESTPGQGSTFWFELPFERPPPAPSTPEAAPLASPEVLRGVRVLVADARPTSREFLQRDLQRWQMRPVLVGTAQEAIATLREQAALGQALELALFDAELPDTDGLSFAQAVRAQPELARTQLVMLSAVGQRPTPLLLQASGIAAALQKPPRRHRLLQSLTRALGARSAAAAAGAESAPSPPTARARSARILLVEDNPVNQLVALTQLKQLGFRADALGNGTEVLSALQREAYDIVLMDCQMPVMDGYEVTRRIRRGEAGQRYRGNTSPYIIALTANAMQGDREECLAAGMNDYLGKPLTLASLEAAMERALTQLPPAPPGAVPPPETDTQVIDRSILNGLRQLREPGQNDPLRELIDLFLRDAQPRVESLQSLLENRDAATLASTAHALKGSASNLGARRLAGLCLNLEKQAKLDDLAAAEQTVEQVLSEFERVRQSLLTEVGR